LATIYQYFKKEFEANKIIVRINPTSFEGLELLISETGEISKTSREFDDSIYEELDFDEFIASSPLEFNLYLAETGK